MALFHPMEWAERVLPAAGVTDAWQLIRHELAAFGMGESTFIFGQPTNTQAAPAPARKFGFFLDEEWDRRIHSDPRLAMGDPIAKRFFATARPLHMRRGNALYRSMSAGEQAFYRHYDEHDVRAGGGMAGA